jgi:dolichyl-phosphate-mannose--protein O-mannosyl transferase
LDGLHLTLARMGLLEAGVTLFIVACIYYGYCYVDSCWRQQSAWVRYCYLAMAGGMLGLACASKWSGLFAFPLLLLGVVYGTLWLIPASSWHIKLKHVLLGLSLILVLPGVIYSLSYLPLASILNSNDSWLSFVWQQQQAMYQFQMHSLIHSTHTYASSWYSWPFLTKPIATYFNREDHGYATSVALIGNPAVFALWLPMLAASAYHLWRARTDWRAWWLLVAMGCEFLPYSLASRVCFLYYFYPTLPLVIILSVYSFNQLSHRLPWRSSWGWRIYLVICVILFLIFLPVTLGVSVPRSYVVHYLLWLPGWNI